MMPYYKRTPSKRYDNAMEVAVVPPVPSAQSPAPELLPAGRKTAVNRRPLGRR